MLFTSLRFSCSLHQCVRKDPPPYIVQLLLAVSPESLSHVDCLHRTPLHIAAGAHAKLSIVQLLADADPAACFVQDVDGKTPLILACESSWGDSPSIELIRILIKAYPTSLSLEDNDGTSALEHAILSEASLEVVEVLQHATAFIRSSEIGHTCPPRRSLSEALSPSQDAALGLCCYSISSEGDIVDISRSRRAAMTTTTMRFLGVRLLGVFTKRKRRKSRVLHLSNRVPRVEEPIVICSQ